MTLDYTALAAVASSLIQAAGRTVTFVALNTTPSDPLKPWNGNSDPRAAPAATLALKAAFVEPSSLDKLGIKTTDMDLFKKSDKIAIVEPVNSGRRLQEYQQVIDEDGEYYQIEVIHELRPASTTLCYFVGICR